MLAWGNASTLAETNATTCIQADLHSRYGDFWHVGAPKPPGMPFDASLHPGGWDSAAAELFQESLQGWVLSLSLFVRL